jgi:CRP/FNR family cyclic AMP-dependent transcriptional regulator
MPTPYNLPIRESCASCAVANRTLCRLGSDALAQLERVKFSSVYPEGALLFVEGQQPRGFFILCAGQVKLSASSSQGKTVILRICDAGDVVGFSSSILNVPYEVTAETIEPAQVSFIKREDFLRFMAGAPEVVQRAVETLSEKYNYAQKEIRALGLAQSSTERLARLLLDWCDQNGEPTSRGLRLKVLLTHTEIAQMIGTTRETVTRQLSGFKRDKTIEVIGSTLFVLNRPALARLVTS